MSWITHSENKLLGDLAISIEKSLMFGAGASSIIGFKKRIARLELDNAVSGGRITLKRYLQLFKLAESNDLESVQMVINILNANS